MLGQHNGAERLQISKEPGMAAFRAQRCWIMITAKFERRGISGIMQFPRTRNYITNKRWCVASLWADSVLQKSCHVPQLLWYSARSFYSRQFEAQSLLSTWHTLKHERAEHCSDNSCISGEKVSTPVQQKAKRYVAHLRDYLQSHHIPAFLIVYMRWEPQIRLVAMRRIILLYLSSTTNCKMYKELSIIQ